MKINGLITMDEVKDFLAKQEHRQTKKRRTDNSYVTFGPRETFQIDLADKSEPEGTYRYAMLCVDVFTKKLYVVPLANKRPETTSQALEKVLSEMDVPNNIYTDEGGELAAAFEEKLKKYVIEHIISRSPPMFVERAIRSLREGINVRLGALILHASQWWKML